MAFVVLQHLDPDRPSMLAKVLEGVTGLAVVEATHGMRVEPNRVYVMPAGFDLTVAHGILALGPRQKTTDRLHLPIDAFFRSLAEDSTNLVIGVVLSGSGSDGTEGLKVIKAEGGIAIAQDPESAPFRSMPENAISAGVVDFRGTPEEIADELTRLSGIPYVSGRRLDESGGMEPTPADDPDLLSVLALVRQREGIDFASYKRTTVLRRVERRMALRRVSAMGEYASLVREEPGEARALAQDMLIHVTSFFRDPGAFAALKDQVFAALVRRKSDGDSIRIWVPGCATGEEVYAVAITLLESLDGQRKKLSIKMFGSDLSGDAIDTARLGRYSETALAGVSPERLSRFFERIEKGFRITKEVRDLVAFVRHDITVDPPFAKLDLISCRNMLIYFDAELQRRVIPMLHYCLTEHGYLFLGKSETIASFRNLFTPVDKEHRIFAKSGESPRPVYPLPTGREVDVKKPNSLLVDLRHPAREAQREADHLQLSRYAPPGVIVNDRLEIIQFRGRTGSYLEAPPGQPQASVVRMARDGLAAHLHEALERAKTQSTVVRKESLRVQNGAETRVVNLEVMPLSASSAGSARYFLVSFEEPGLQFGKLERMPPRVLTDAQPGEDMALEVERLRAELVATRDYLQSLVSEHQSSSDDLAAANEELIAANEELQSTNEELQSAKEELQSTNEELGTVNDQLRSRNQELDEVANDLVNVLASVEIPVIIVDIELRVRRFTPTVRSVASFIPEDVGRPIDDLKLKMQVKDLPARIKAVISAMAPREWEVQDLDGRWFRMQIRPYRTSDNRLDGAVLSFVEVDALKRALGDSERARDYARSIVETVSSALIVLDGELRVVSANQAFFDLFSLTPETTKDEPLFELAAGVFKGLATRRALGDVVALRTGFSGLELTAETSHLGRRVLRLTGRPLLWGAGAPMVLLAIEDVTGMRMLETERAQLLESEKQARLDAERANRAKDLFLATLSHELRTPLSTMLMSSQVLRRVASDDARIERATASIERAANSQGRLINDLLDVSRIVAGKMLLNLGPVDFAAVVQEAVDVARPSAQAKALGLEVAIQGEIGTVYGDAGRLLQVVSNLVTNAIKFTPHGGRIAIRLDRAEAQARLSITDTGIGIRPEVMPLLFSRFVQADSSVTRTHGGLGLGLAIVRHLVEAHGGVVEAESPGEGKGATFRVSLPVGSTADSKPAASRRTAARSIAGVRVLLLEDDDDTREAYATMLAELGADVRAVSSAAAGRAALESFVPQVILSDIAMPGEDGFSFIETVRRLDPERGGHVPAAALTALASDEDRQRALRAGFQMHVAKPVDVDRLVAVVGLLADWKWSVP
jgi:two-component system CheB/CheR fusion protein